MADEIKLKAPTVEQQVNVVINGEEKLKSFASTLENIASNKNLQKYWKDQKQLIDDVTDAYSNFTKNTSKNNALELMKTTNALKALSDVDISSLIPDFKNFSQALENAKKVAGSLDSAFSVNSFKVAFSSFETLRAYGIDLENFFKHFELDINVTNLQESLRLAQQETRRVRRELSETQEELSSKKIELDSFIDGSGLTEQIEKLRYLEDELRYVREQASEEFRTFLKGNDFSGWDLDENGAFERYFNEIRDGSLTAKEAIANFKSEYSYLLREKFNESGGLFNLQQAQTFENKLETVLHRVEEISRQMNDIIENGVMTKAMQNLSVDDTISQSQRDLFANVLKDEEALSSIAGVLKKIIDESVTLQGVNNKTFDEEQFNRLLILFEKIESSLSSMKAIFVDVGDGEEFSPLLKMIDRVQSSIKELSTSVKGIGLNMNIDVGSDSEMEAKVQSKISNALQAYQRLFDHIKMSGVGDSMINTNFFEFDINQYDTMMAKLQAYRKFIENMRKEVKTQYNGKDILYQRTDKSYWSAASAAMGQMTKAFNEMNASADTSPLDNLFGGGKELTEVVAQLNIIADKLGEISATTSKFKNVFANGFNVSASVEEIEKLTSRVKELENELSKVKISSTSPVETNISSGIKDTFQGETEASEMGKVATAVDEAVQAKKDFATANEGVQASVDGSKSKLELETELMERLAKSAREAADAKKEFVEANKQVQGSIDDTGKSVKKDKYKNKSKISEDEYTGKSDYYASIVNQKLKNSGNTILGETVSTELVDGLVKVTAKIKTADDTWKTFSAKIDADGNMFEQRFRTITKGVDKLETELKNFGLETNPALSYGETLKKAEEIRSSLKLDDSYTIKVDSNELVTITQKLSDVKSSTTSVTQTFKSAQDAIEHFGKEASSSAEKTTVALKGVKASAESIGEAVGESFNFESIDKSLDKYNDKLRNFKVKPANGHRYPIYQKNIDDLTEKVSKLQTLRDNLSKKDINLISKEDIDEVNTLEKDIDELIFKMSKMSAGEKGFDPLSLDKAIQKMTGELEKVSGMSKKAKSDIQALIKELSTGNPTRTTKEILHDFYKIIQAEQEAGRYGKAFMDIFKDKVIYGAAGQLAGMFGFYDIINYGKQAIDTIVELDTALIDLKKTTAMTSHEMEDFYFEANSVAKDMGVTTSAIIEQSSAWSRLGYDTKTASTEMAKLSSQFASISPGMDTDTSQAGLVSIMKAWNLDYSDVKSEVMDNINALGNSMALDNQDLVEGMQRSAAALAAVGTSYEDAFSMFSGIQEVLQNAEKSGTALRSVALRIRSFDESTEEYSQDLANITGELIELTKTAEHSQGISIFKDGSTTEFKSLVDYFGEISEIWDEMTEKQQNDYLIKAFGRTQAQAGSALIQNYSAVEKAIEVMEDSLGSSDREMETIRESLSYKINALKETWVGTVQEMIDRGDLGKIIDGLTKLSETVGFVLDKFGMLGTIGIGAGAFAGFQNVG